MKAMLITAILFTMAAVSSCIPDSALFNCKNDDNSTAAFSAAQESIPPKNDQESAIVELQESVRYHYGLLDPHKQNLYRKILNAYLNMKGTVNIYGFENETVYYVRNCVLRDYPELWFVGGGTITEYHRSGSVIDKIYGIAYLYSPSDVARMQSEIDKNVDEFLKSVDPSLSKFEKLIRVYEFIILNTGYDQGAYSLVRSEKDDMQVNLSASIYGVFVKGKAICEGYSKAAQYLLGRLGISCGFASGTSKKDGIAHAWNFLWLDEEPYFLDLTWGDPVSSDPLANGNLITYDYFCITTEQLQKTHIPDPAYPLPLCNAEKYNYYAYNGLLLDVYEEEAVLEILFKEFSKANRSASIKFSDDSELLIAFRELIEEERIFSLLQKINERGVEVNTKAFSYSIDEQNHVLTIYPINPIN